MKNVSHLFLQSVELAPSDEWESDGAGWCFVRASQQSGFWLGQDGATELVPGEVLVLSPVREGCFRASQLGPLLLHHFRFTPEVAGGLLTPLEHDIFEALARAPQFAVRRFAPDTAVSRAWTELLMKPAAGYSLAQRLELLHLVVEAFSEDLQRPVPSTKCFISTRVKLRLLLNQIPETEFLRLTPRDLGAYCGVSAAQATRSFRMAFGLSLAKRQELVRLQQARQALAETTESIEAVAAEAGYSDTRSFINAFKKHFCISPHEWKRPRGRGDKASPLTG